MAIRLTILATLIVLLSALWAGLVRLGWPWPVFIPSLPIVSIAYPGLGNRLSGLGLLGMAIWLLGYDIARKTVRKEGLPRYAATCLLSGYAWLGLACILAILFGYVAAGFHYDALLHSIFLGFVFSMIFGHAPIILPSLLGFPFRFRRILYIPLALIHASLVLRVAGDLFSNQPQRMWGGLYNIISVLLFMVIIASLVLTVDKVAYSRLHLRHT